MVRPARRPGAATTSSRPTSPTRCGVARSICERLEMYPVECVARGYLTGSGLLDYRATGEVCGIALPDGLVDGSRLPEPIFTPGHQGGAGRPRRERLVRRGRGHGRRRAPPPRLRDLTLAVYDRAEDDRPRRAASSWPTPSSSSGVDPTAPHGARRRGADARLLPLLAGRRVAAGPRAAVVRQADRAQLAALRRSPAGTAPRVLLRPRCRPRSSSAPAAGTSRPTSGSPASQW